MNLLLLQETSKQLRFTKVMACKSHNFNVEFVGKHYANYKDWDKVDVVDSNQALSSYSSHHVASGTVSDEVELDEVY